MPSTICIIRRAVLFRGGSSSHFGLDVPAPVWQSPQHKLSDAVNTPIVPMNSSTGMPFSTWTFLKACSDICAAEPACAWAVIASATVVTQASANEAATNAHRFDNNLIELSIT